MIVENIDFNIIKYPKMRGAVTLQVIHSCGHSGSFIYNDEQVAEAEAEHLCSIPCAFCAVGITKQAS